MTTAWKKTATTAVLLTMILLLSAAVAFLAADSSKSDFGDYDESYELEEDWDDFGDDFPDYDAETYAAHASAGVTPGGGGGKTSGSGSGVDDLVSANGLVMELRRIVRAGRSMDALRKSPNPVQRRRCVDGSQKLQSDAQSIRARRKNLAIKASTESISLSRVFSNVMKCVSCDGDAVQACNLAQQDLDIIIRSLSLD